jgi:hypothetical protein
VTYEHQGKVGVMVGKNLLGQPRTACFAFHGGGWVVLETGADVLGGGELRLRLRLHDIKRVAKDLSASKEESMLALRSVWDILQEDPPDALERMEALLVPFFYTEGEAE